MQPIYIYRSSDEKPLDAVRVDRFPEFPLPQRTVAVHTVNFQGKVTVQASILLKPTLDDHWVTVWDEDFDVRTEDLPSARNRMKNLCGNFIWMRVQVQTVTGLVDRVLVI
jgi:hypothetical protein